MKTLILVSKPRWSDLWRWTCVDCLASGGLWYATPGDAADAGRIHRLIEHEMPNPFVEADLKGLRRGWEV